MHTHITNVKICWSPIKLITVSCPGSSTPKTHDMLPVLQVQSNCNFSFTHALQTPPLSITAIAEKVNICKAQKHNNTKSCTSYGVSILRYEASYSWKTGKKLIQYINKYCPRFLVITISFDSLLYRLSSSCALCRCFKIPCEVAEFQTPRRTEFCGVTKLNRSRVTFTRSDLLARRYSSPTSRNEKNDHKVEVF